MPIGTHYSALTAVTWTPLVPESVTLWNPNLPQGSNPQSYWTARGNLATVLGKSSTSNGIVSTSFQTRYLHQNFLAALPPPRWNDKIRSEQPVNASIESDQTGDSVKLTPLGNGPREVAVGQILMDDMATQYLNNTAYGNAPWGTYFHRNTIDSYGINAAFSRVAQQLGTLQLFDQYGLPDFSIVGHAVTDTRTPASSPDAHVFTAAFTKVIDGVPTISFFAFNPGTQPVVANFWRVTDTSETTPLVTGGGLLVQPKRWAKAQSPVGAVQVHTPMFHAAAKHFTFTVDLDHRAILHVERSRDLKTWEVVPVSAHSPSEKTYKLDLGAEVGAASFYRITTLDR